MNMFEQARKRNADKPKRKCIVRIGPYYHIIVCTKSTGYVRHFRNKTFDERMAIENRFAGRKYSVEIELERKAA